MHALRLPLSELWLIFVLSIFRYPLLYNHGTVNLYPVYFFLRFYPGAVLRSKARAFYHVILVTCSLFQTFGALPGKLVFHLTFGNVADLKHLKYRRKKYSLIKTFSAVWAENR